MMLAEEARKGLAQAKAIADTQPRVVDAERSVQIAEFNAQAAIKQAGGDAQAKTINAKADAEVLKVVGDAEGGKITAIGTAEAAVIKLKTEAVGQGNYATIEVGRALANAGIPLVPQIIAGSGAGSDGGGSLVNMLLAQLIAKSLPESPAKPSIPPAVAS